MNPNDIRLVRDGIREAIFEARFETRLPPEIVIGRLSDAAAWKDRLSTRLPTAEAPMQLREIDPQLRYSPSYQLATPDGLDLVRVGPFSISCNRLAPYPGWQKFSPAIYEAASTLFTALQDPAISRLGLRYTNALNKNEHHVGGAADLNVTISTAGRPVVDDLILVFKNTFSGTHVAQVTIATPQFVQAPADASFDALIDVDVSTLPGHYFRDLKSVQEWIDEAHRLLKEQFFSLIPIQAIDKLRA